MTGLNHSTLPVATGVLQSNDWMRETQTAPRTRIEVSDGLTYGPMLTIRFWDGEALRRRSATRRTRRRFRRVDIRLCIARTMRRIVAELRLELGHLDLEAMPQFRREAGIGEHGPAFRDGAPGLIGAGCTLRELVERFAHLTLPSITSSAP